MGSPAPTPSSSRSQLHVPRYTPSPSFLATSPAPSGRFTTPDVPASRPKHRPSARQGFYGRNTAQVPLSALCRNEVEPGAVGGPFCSTTKVKCVPLPSLSALGRHLTPMHMLRNVSIHGRRYTPAPAHHSRHAHPPSGNTMASYSMLELKLGESQQKKHLLEHQKARRNCDLVQRSREVVPHRLNWAFYMMGEQAQMFDKQELSAEEVRALQELALSQNSALLYGTGIKGGTGHTSKQVADFQGKLKHAVREVAGLYRGLKLEQLDFGRYSRMSRTLTPGSPILEEEDTPTQSGTFLTQEPGKDNLTCTNY